MPNGGSHFDAAGLDAWFQPIAADIEGFAADHNLLVTKYYHSFPTWDLQFNHPLGGHCSIEIARIASADEPGISSVWWLDDLDAFTRYLLDRPQRFVAKVPEVVSRELAVEFRALLSEPLGGWTRVVDDYADSWAKFSKDEFESMQPRFPDPIL